MPGRKAKGANKLPVRTPSKGAGVVKFRKPNTEVAEVGDLTGTGWINKKLRVNIVDKRDASAPQNKGLFLFTIAVGKGTICGKSFREYGKSNFTALMPGCTYIVQGSIQRKLKSRKYSSNTNSGHELHFLNSLTIIQETQPCSTSSFQTAAGRGIPKKILSQPSRPGGRFGDVKDVTFVSGFLQTYIGCDLCATSIRFRNEKGKFICPSSKCSKKKKETKLKVYMIIRDMTLNDDAGNALDGIVCFNSDVEKLIGRKVVEFQNDAAPRQLVENAFGSRINGRVTVKKAKDLSLGKVSIVVTELEILVRHVPRIEQHSVDVVPLSPATVLAPFEVYDDESLEPEFLDIQIRHIPAEARGLRHGVLVGQYILGSSPPGASLVICNEFSGARERKGCRVDVQNTSTLLERLNMPIFEEPFMNVDYEMFQTTLTRFKNFVKEKQLSSLCIVIMSHGRYNEIEMADGRRVTVEPDLIQQFSLDGFPEFAGKPKIFIIQACQPYATPQAPNDIVTRVIPKRSYRCPDCSDILICMPTLPGYFAFRQSSRGSVFLRHLCRVFMEYASFMDIQQMLTEVAKRVKKDTTRAPTDPTQPRSSDNEDVDHIQISYIMPIIFDKFYFQV